MNKIGLNDILRKRRSRNAFTLIELLVVAAIVALLMALVFSCYRAARNAAAEAVCLSNVRAYGNATLTMLADHNGILDAPVGTIIAIDQFVSLYQPNILTCPNHVWSFGGNYAVNTALFFATGGNLSGGPGIPIIQPHIPVNSIALPHDRVVLVSEAYASEAGGLYLYMDMTMWADPGKYLTPDQDLQYASSPAQYHGSFSHRGLNLFMLDGSAALVYPYGGGGWGPPTDGGMSPGETYGMPGNTGYYYSLEQFETLPGYP